jgi:excinuclease ABC subunit B
MAAKFELVSDFQPAGDQPAAIAKLVDGFREGRPCQTLLGATGTGKTFTAAHVLAQLNKPTRIRIAGIQQNFSSLPQNGQIV